MRSVPRLVLLAAIAAVPACSDGATDPELAGLTRTEAARLAVQISSSYDVLNIPTASRAPAASFSVTGKGTRAAAFPVTREVPCELGGDVLIEADVSLDLDPPAQSGSLETSAAAVHRDCGILLEGSAVRVDGAPQLTVASEYAWAGGGQTRPARVTHTGAIAWARDTGETGECEVRLVGVSDLLEGSRTVRGSLCGLEIDEELPFRAAS